MQSVVAQQCAVKVGDRFDRLEVIGPGFYVKENSRRRIFVVCKCSCGNIICSRYDGLGKRLHSCGCYWREKNAESAKAALTTHGMSKHPLYKIRRAMINRCTNPKQKCWEHYGGRGIAVCQQWATSPQAFFDWAMANGWEQGLQIDREDNNGNYEPGNCRWVTGSRNCRNQRRSRMITAFGETKCLKDWSEDVRSAVSYSTLSQRIRFGWPPETAITTERKQ